MKKRVITVVMTAIMALSLAACGNANADAEDGSTQVMANLDESTVSDETPEPETTEEPSAQPTSPEASAEPAEGTDEDASAEETEEPSVTKEPAQAEEPAQTAEELAEKAEADRIAAEAAAAQAEADRIAAEKAAAEAKAAADKAAAEAAAQQAQSTPQPAQQPAQGNETADVKDTTPVVPATPTPAPAPTPAPHEHSWTPIYDNRTVTVVVQEEWFEPEIVELEFIENHIVCDQCGTDFGTDPIKSNGAAYDHIVYSDCTSASNREVKTTEKVDLGSVICHPAVTETRTEQVLVGYTCGCGATK